MGKSNKFDYTNRNSVGKRLGDIIGGALQKEAEKVKKEAERNVQKARKRSLANGSSAIESPVTTHALDLKAPGKDLGDDGVSAMADGLEAALKARTDTASLFLEDLNVSNNGITVASLARLAPVIELARSTLKNLNISGNPIKVESETEAKQWEVFLQSLSVCQKMRRLDLSNNVHLGAKALEILAKLHFNESSTDPSAQDKDGSPVMTSGSESDYEGSSDMESQDNSREHSESKDRLVKTQGGLRSIPFIILTNIGLKDAGALWLSFVIEDHAFPAQLLDELNVSSAEAATKSSQQGVNSQGIEWADNSDLGKDGLLLLQKTEVVREQSMQGGKKPVGNSATTNEVADVEEAGDSNRKSIDKKSSLSHRRTSSRISRAEERVALAVAEIDSLRGKIRRHVIAESGVSSVELWQAALKLFAVARLVLFVTTFRKASTSEPHLEGLPFNPPFSPITQSSSSKPFSSNFQRPSLEPSSPLFPPFPTPTFSPIIRPPTPKSFSSNVQPPTPESRDVPPTPTNSPAAAAAVVAVAAANRSNSHQRTQSDHSKYTMANREKGNSEFTLTDVTNTHRTPFFKSHHKSASHKQALKEEEKEASADAAQVTSEMKALNIHHDVGKSPNMSKPPRSAIVLPENVIERIASFILNDREMMVMSKMQRSEAIKRGQDRGSLAMEREWSRMKESAQVWMLLDSIHCLAYEK